VTTENDNEHQGTSQDTSQEIKEDISYEKSSRKKVGNEKSRREKEADQWHLNRKPRTPTGRMQCR